jgi:hypothetical protein
MDPHYQMVQMSGGKKLQPNHIDVNVAAAVLKNCDSVN